MSPVLVTGGLGYVGRHLVARLEAEGQTVVSYNRDFASSSNGSPTHFVQGELFDIPRLVSVLGEHGIDQIIHTAAMSHPELSVDLPITTVAANVEGTTHLLEAARMAGVRSIVNFSSETVYGHIDGPVTEDGPLRPTTPYGVTKAAVEMLASVYGDLYGLEITSLRITEIYGPGNRMPQYLRSMIRASLDHEPFKLEQGADQAFHFIHVDDVVEAVVLAAGRPGSGHRAYNITGGSQTTLAEAAQLVSELIPEADLELGAGHLPLDRQGPWEITRAKRELDYEPTRPLGEGIAAYVEWLKDHEC